MSLDDLKGSIRSHSKERIGANNKSISDKLSHGDEPKSHTLTIKPSHIEKLKDYVHYMKTSGYPYFTQGEAVQQALSLLFDQVGEISSRPEELRQKEKRRTGRRKSTGSSKSSNDIFQ